MNRFVVTAALASLAAAPLSAQGTDVTIDRAVAAYGRMKSARATFEQTLLNPLTGTTVVAKGEMLQQKPGRLSVRFTDPEGDRIVSDGKVLWAYMPSSNPRQVVKMPLTEGGAASVDLAEQFLKDPRTKYQISDAGAATVSGRATHALNLLPRQPMQFRKATVWIDDRDGSLRQFEITDGNGLTRTVRLTSLALNVPVPSDAFTFKPPKGVKVFDQAAMMDQQ